MALPGTRGDAAPPAIELRGISQAFGPVQANRDISLVVPAGTIHGIVGENGAGKSTLMSILYGFYRPDAGQILIGGRDAGITDSQSAIRAGIGMVFQHFMLVDTLSVTENVILGAEPRAGTSIDYAGARRRVAGPSRPSRTRWSANRPRRSGAGRP